MRHIGAVIGNHLYKEKYVSEFKQPATALVKSNSDRATISICSIC